MQDSEEPLENDLERFFTVIRFDELPNVLLISFELGLLRGIIYRSFIDWVVYLIKKND